jgi:hypothetical protein
MGLRPTQGDENRFYSFFCSFLTEASSRPKRGGRQTTPTRFLRYKQKCHPDRSAAKWRDLLFTIHNIESEWKRHSPLCHPDRSVPGFPATLNWTRPRVRLSVRERRMKCISATKFHRKSGGAKWRDLQFCGPLMEMFSDRCVAYCRTRKPYSTW